MLLFDLSQIFSRIRLLGATRLDFLHRMSTGDVRGLQPGEGKPTVLTTPIGRIVDYLIVLAFDDSALLIGGAGNQDKTIRWLRKYIFFNDDVQLNDETGDTRLFGIGGEGDHQLFERIGLDAGAFPLSECAHRTIASALSSDGRVTVVRAPQATGLSFFLIGRGLDLAPLAGEPSVEPDFDTWRISQGYPRFPNEISEDYIPLEAGLWGAVSFDKGCYIGQEIIARMESRGQIAKKLVKLTTTDLLAPGDDLRTEGGEVVGKVTSATQGAALGYVRSAYAQEGVTLLSGHGWSVRIAKIVQI